MTDTTPPPAETLAEAREAAALAFDARARKAGHPTTVTMERHHAKVIRAGEGDEYDAVQAAVIALTRRAGGDAIMTSALNQNDAMRQELAHVGNLVSDLARALKVDQANDDGTWPDLAGRIQRLIAATPKPPAGGDAIPNSWSRSAEDTRAMALLLAEVELHLKSSRVFITTREKMHPCGVDLHDELSAKVTAALDSLGRDNGV